MHISSFLDIMTVSIISFSLEKQSSVSYADKLFIPCYFLYAFVSVQGEYVQCHIEFVIFIEIQFFEFGISETAVVQNNIPVEIIPSQSEIVHSFCSFFQND